MRAPGRGGAAADPGPGDTVGLVVDAPHVGRARAVVSPEIHVPANLDRDGLETNRLVVERLLNRLTLEAEAWAESGTRKVCETALRRESLWRGYTRLDPPHANETADKRGRTQREKQFSKIVG